jgi:hypothetical protein
MRASILAVVTAACGGGHPSEVDGPPPVDTPPDMGTQTMDVHGVGTLFNVVDDGSIVTRLRDFSQVRFTSFSPTTNGFDQRSGTGRSDGTFVVPVDQGVPAWQLEVQLESGANQILVGNAQTPDLTEYRLGRPDQTLPTQSTPVTLAATGLAAWQDTDSLQILSSNAGATIFDVQLGFATPPTAGSTSVNQDFDWQLQFAPLVDAAKGDKTQVYQLVTKPLGAEHYIALARLGSTATFTTTDGAPATLGVALAAVPQNKTLAIHFKRSQFEAMRAEAGPGATASTTQLFAIDALPGASSHGFYASASDLVISSPTPAATDLDQTFVYGNPFSTNGTAWDEFAIVYYQFDVPVLAAGAQTPRIVPAGAYAYMPLSALTNGTVAPTITPVRNVKVNGQDLMTARTGVGLTPTITWDAPTTGSATYYTVSVRQVLAANMTTSLRTVATFETKSTSLQLPPSILANSSSYVLRITAQIEPGYDATVTPFQGGLDYASASVVTAQLTP